MSLTNYRVLLACCLFLLSGWADYCQAESLTIHQRASVCWEEPKKEFEDEPTDCDTVCNTCHSYATVVEGQSGNPEAVTTDETYPGDFPPDAGEEVGWDSLGIHQQSCRDCHVDISETETAEGTRREDGHPIFFEYAAGPVGSTADYIDTDEFKATDLKLFDMIVLCTTCHAPHSDNRSLLRLPNELSSLCLNCHKK